jgi:stage III sporulation protein AG
MLEEWIREKSKEGGANSWLRSKPVQYLVLILVCLGLLALIWPTGSEQKLAERPGTGLESLDPTQGSKQISQEVASILACLSTMDRMAISIPIPAIRKIISISMQEPPVHLACFLTLFSKMD